MKSNPNVRRAVRLVSVLLLAAGTTACDGVFEVDNPNQLVASDLARPEAATALVNGAEATVARGVSQILLPLSVASDELKAIGSYDAGRELDHGFLTNPVNEFTNGAFPFVAEGRYMADQAIRQLEQFDAERRLRNRADLARAYLYGAIVYSAIADAFDDFVISDGKQAAPPIGEANMVQLYDRAVASLDKGLVAARAAGRGDLELAILAVRARVKHARAVWVLLNPRGRTPTDPLVSDPGAVADARAALRLLPEPDWKLQFRYGAATVPSQLGAWINIRQEFRVGDVYAVPTPDNKRAAAIRLLDPIDQRPDPALQAQVEAFAAAAEYPALTVASARELRLIVAEAALASGDPAEAAGQINEVRRLNGLTPYQGQVPLLQLLQHQRRVNLFLQGRRLADQYRFRSADAAWQPSSDAVRAPGTFLPIAEVERLSNCHLLGTCR